MQLKYFAGASPVNRLMSFLMSGGVQWRLLTLRLKNRLKTAVKPQHCQLINDAETSRAFLSLMGQGYSKVNIGGGAKNLRGFVNIDFMAHAGVEREIKANILDLSFIPDSSLTQIHSNHVAEHLTPDEFKVQLKEYFRMMKTGGVLTMRCPNALGVCYGLWFDVVPETERDEFVRLGFPADEEFCSPLDGWYHKNLYGFVHWIYGDAGNISNQHLNILTPSRMKAAVAAAGFEVVKMSEPETSNIIIVACKS